MTPLEIAAALRARRLELGLTLMQVADRVAGMTYQNIGNYESSAVYGARSSPAKPETLQRWAAALGGQVDLVLTFPTEPPVGTGIAPG